MPHELGCCLMKSFDNMYKVSLFLFQALEKFLYEASSLLAKLEEIQDGLDKEDFSDTLEGLKDQIKHNQHVKKWIIKAPVELLQEEGEKIRNTIKNPNYEDSEDSLTEDDVKKAELQIQELVEGLHTKRQKLRELWNLRKMRLDQCFQYRVFQQDAEKVKTFFDRLSILSIFLDCLLFLFLEFLICWKFISCLHHFFSQAIATHFLFPLRYSFVLHDMGILPY